MKRYKFKFSKRINNIFTLEITNLSYNYVFNSQLISKIARQKAALILSYKGLHMSKNFSFCLATGRTRFVNNKFMISRNVFDKKASTANLFGFFISNN